jgi:hypothetical protein
LKTLLFTLLLHGLAIATANAQGTVVERFPNGPILTPQIIGERSAFNLDRESTEAPFISIAGPSLIRVPDWVDQPLGRYYLYFAHHKGAHIRLAYSDQLEGPWNIYNPGLGVLRLADMADLIEDHIASPDVHVDQEHQQIKMYFHGPRKDVAFDQRTWLATSDDGLRFQLHTDELLGEAYFRTFRWGGFDYTPARLGPIYRSIDGAHNFELGPTLFDSNFRHFAVRVHNNRGYFFYSRKTENPERIRLITVDLSDDWQQWAISPSSVVLTPTESYETSHGAKVLDPCLYEEDGQNYLLYSISDERGIAIAKLGVTDWQGLNVNEIRARSLAPYRVANSLLSSGQKPFLDSDITIQQVPSDVQGSLPLLTAMADVRSSGHARFMSFSVSRRTRVWVAHDDRFATRPGWLLNWQTAGSQVNLADGPQSWPMTLFYKDFGPGEIKLGGNVADGAPLAPGRSMFCVFLARTP